jgi:peptide/nickel transport system substrate-binding protein
VQGDNIGQNYSRGGDPRVDKLFPELNAATDDKTSQDLANQIDKLLWDNMYTIPLYQKPTFLAYNSNYTGFQENASSAGPLWDSTKIALKQ